MKLTESSATVLTQEQTDFFNREGYLIIRGLFGANEVAELRQRFERLADNTEPAPAADLWQPDWKATDPLVRYPRVMMPHRWDALSKRWLLDSRLHDVLQALIGDEPIATQSMFYFKPPGARGQALHQDNFYLQVEPQTCIAAWIAIDPSTPANGGLHVVPKTHDHALACPEQADMTQSFFTHYVKPPEGKASIPAELQSGDTLFFNGNLIHGSGPNHSANQWRRSYICHYMAASSRCISQFYFPLLNFAGEEVTYAATTSGGPCGVQFKEANFGA